MLGLYGLLWFFDGLRLDQNGLLTLIQTAGQGIRHGLRRGQLGDGRFFLHNSCCIDNG